MHLRLATRKSPLALVQARLAAAALQKAHRDMEVELVPITSQGDTISGRLADHGGKELFVHALQQAMRAGQADAACHSLKDVGADSDEFVLAAFLPRGPAADALIGKSLAELEVMDAPRIGTSSPRRTGLIKSLLPGAQPVEIRGNVGTRIEKIAAGKIDALLLAAAGLHRLNLQASIAQVLPCATFVPAPGQGIIALECQRAKGSIAGLLAAVSDPETGAAALAERAVAARVAGDCHTPLAAHATVVNGQVQTTCLLTAPDGSALARAQGLAEQPQQSGRQAAEQMLDAGGRQILAQINAGG
ncbi:MAG: hydroxymethylbilane synthase [Betaproteobacteria bacterium]|nr:hydroxymethylbilane synthase [Betaproteobacteria bacterium]